MYYDDYTMLSFEDVEKIKTKLNIIRLLIEDNYAKDKIDEILQILNKEEINEKNISIDEVILKAMNETKTSKPDISANLYILYRRLQEKKIDPVEATKLYELYINE